MRKVWLFVVLLIVAGVVTSAEAARSDSPALGVVTRQPLVVRGIHFQSGERVRVVVVAGRRSSKIVRASFSGGFVASFDRSVGRCTRFTVQAFGRQGSRATLRSSRVSIDCMPTG